MATQNQKLDYMTLFQQHLTAMFAAQQALISLQAKATLQGLVIDETLMVGEFEGMTAEEWQAAISATMTVITGISPESSAAMAAIIK